MSLIVLSPGFMTSVQDAGRTGYERFGVPPSGAMDWFALYAANCLVGNSPGAAGLEFTLEAPVLQAAADCLVAAGGRGFDLWVHGRQVGMWMAAWVRRGEVIHFQVQECGGWGYLAAAGGFDTLPVLGSRSTYLRGALGGLDGRCLRAGDQLILGATGLSDPYRLAGRYIAPQLRPRYEQSVSLAVIMGPQLGAFTPHGVETFLSSGYRVSPTSDRTGYRLSGNRIEHSGSADLLSEGMAPGSVQVPADGQPIVMMSDRPTSGGYAKIATLARAATPLLAQCPPGSGEVHFQQVSVQQAQRAYREQVRILLNGMMEDDDGS